MIRFTPVFAECFEHTITSITSLTVHEIEAGILRGEYRMVNECLIVDGKSPCMVVDKETSEVLATIKTQQQATTHPNGGKLEIVEIC